MLRIFKNIMASILLIISLSGCTTGQKQTVGIIGGGVLGGVAGSAITGGSTAGTIVGAVGGGLIGNSLAK